MVLEKNTLSILNYINNLTTVNECLYLLYNTKLNDIKKKLYLKKFIEIDKLYLKSIENKKDDITLNEKQSFSSGKK